MFFFTSNHILNQINNKSADVIQSWINVSVMKGTYILTTQDRLNI